MTRRLSRRGLRALAVCGALAATGPTVLLATASHAVAAPSSTAAPVVRTGTAAAPVFGLYALTGTVRATSTGGDFGPAGGLAPLDSGSASVDTALDSNPSATVLARPVEPGTTYATVTSQLPGLVSPLPAPPTVPLPQAAAAYPGTTPKGSATGATAAASASSAAGAATSAGDTEGGLTLGTTTATSTLTSAGGGHTVTAVADSYVSGLDVLGVLSLRGVRGHAEISTTAGGGAQTVTATTTVGSATVAGQAVTLDDTGVHAVGATTPLGPSLATLSATANTALKNAGISVKLLAPIHTTGTTALGRSAAADSGGLSVTVTNPDLGLQQVATGNTVTLTLASDRLSETDQASIPASTPIDTGSTGTTTPGTTGTTGTAGTQGSAGTVVTTGGTATGTPAPVVAGTPAGPALSIAGLRVSTRGAIAAVGGWQLLTLGVATYGVLALRNRPEDEEEVLCPCPT